MWLLSLATGLINAGYLSMMGLLKTIFVLRLGYGADFVGTLMAAGSLSFALSSLLGGILGGRFGAQPRDDRRARRSSRAAWRCCPSPNSCPGR